MTLYDNRDSTLSGAYWQYISSITFVFVGGIFYIFLIHFYNIQIVGVFSLLSAIIYLFSTVFSLGLQQGVQHFISFHLGRGDDEVVRSYIKKFIPVAFGLSFLAFAALWLLSPLLGFLFFHTNSYIEYLRLIDIELLFVIINSILLAMLLGLQNFRLNGLLNVLNLAVGYGLIIPFIIMNSDPIRIIYAWITGYFLTTIFSFYYVQRRMRSPKMQKSAGVRMIPVLSYSFPIFISGLISYGAAYVDRFIVSYLLNLSELGVYNFALLIVNAMSILTGPFGVILLSRLSAFYGKNDMENFKLYSLKSTEVIIAIYVPLALIVAALSPSILLFLANSNYTLGSLPIMIILISSTFTISTNIFSVTLQAIRKTRLFIISSSVALLVNFILSVLLIPRYGINGAAVGFASTGVGTFFVILYFARKYGTFVIEYEKILKIYASGFGVFFLMLAVQERLGYSILKLFIFIATGIAVYLFLIRVTEAFSEEDINLFLNMMPGNFVRLKRFFKSLFV